MLKAPGTDGLRGSVAAELPLALCELVALLFGNKPVLLILSKALEWSSSRGPRGLAMTVWAALRVLADDDRQLVSTCSDAKKVVAVALDAERILGHAWATPSIHSALAGVLGKLSKEMQAKAVVEPQLKADIDDKICEFVKDPTYVPKINKNHQQGGGKKKERGKQKKKDIKIETDR